jgi:Putative zinc-finger
VRRIAGIEGGVECERLAPLLSALADGEASAEELAMLRPHMKTCLSCRARLKEFRAAPKRVAALVPPAALAVAGGSGQLRGLLESLVGAAQHKAAVFGERVHAAAELASAQKTAAIAASAAALAGGGTAVDRLAHQPRSGQAPARAAQTQPVKQETPAVPDPAPAPPPQPTPDPAPTAPPPAPAPAEPAPPPPPPPPDPANEFAPSAAAPAAAAPAAPPPAQPIAPASGGFAPAKGAGGGGGSGGGAGGGPGEFAP